MQIKKKTLLRMRRRKTILKKRKMKGDGYE